MRPESTPSTLSAAQLGCGESSPAHEPERVRNDVEHRIEHLDRSRRRSRHVEDQRERPGCRRRPRQAAQGLTARIASARPGSTTVEHAPGALGRLVTGTEPRATRRHDQPVEPVRHVGQRVRHRLRAVDAHPMLDDRRSPSPASRSTSAAPERSSRVPAITPSDTVSTFACEADPRSSWASHRSHRGDGTRHRKRPSRRCRPSAAAGSLRHDGRHGSPGGLERAGTRSARSLRPRSSPRRSGCRRCRRACRRGARADRGLGSSRPLELGQAVDVGGLDPPPGVGSASQHTETRAGRVDRTWSKDAGRNGGPGRIADERQDAGPARRGARRSPPPARPAAGCRSIADHRRTQPMRARWPCRPARRRGRRRRRPRPTPTASATHCEARSWV